MKLVVDTDVIISAGLSSQGASALVLHTCFQNPNLFFLYSSQKQWEEIKKVQKRLEIKYHFNVTVFEQYFQYATILNTLPIQKAENYIFDPNDAMIAAQALEGNVQFLVTYNIRDFDTEKLREKANTCVLLPGAFLQYLRDIGFNI